MASPEEITLAPSKELLDRIRKARNREVMSEFIRIGESDLYDYAPVYRAILREIAFLQVNDEKTKVPQDSPFKGEYVGWCYASERRLAARVGSTEGHVKNAVALMEKHGVITTRLWKDTHGYPHQEYHVLSEVVTAHQRPEDYMQHKRKAPRRGGNKQANKGSFKLGNTVRATAHDSRIHSTPQPIAIAHGSRMPLHTTADVPAHIAGVNPPHIAADVETAEMSLKAVVCLAREKHSAGEGLEGFSLAGSHPASGPASVAAGAARLETGLGVSANQKINQNPNTNGLKPNGHGQMPTGQILKGQRTPTNRDTYHDLYATWLKSGSRKLPKCKRCREYTIQWNEPAHVCEGYNPKYSDYNYEARMANQDELREDRMGRARDSREDTEEIASETFHAEEIQ